ncbi:MAG: bifunctional hydroxymethylpyrimidine kinase/phosphomethylpyrimidine kinase [Candidatus Omnitrophica bacterium]|nr:bifunctional hydroxymethylpyrimidine kinase/phosphomethylpyrimidine kinase [Candidatus Omnitrophota bacterium]MBI5023618.1 bifunctional hydroxymethylpyrimidine kinase/phosphomethylpyrimidine kinase [Candidatus Omnitrophota bacterium]
MDLIALGTIALDNVKTASGARRGMLGGSAAHFAMGARLFTKVHLVGIIGHDFPDAHIRFLRKKGVDLTSVVTHNGKSFRWEGEYRKGDYNNAITLATELGVLLDYAPRVAAHQRKIPNLFLANIDPDVQMRLLGLMGRPRFIGLDSMNLWINHKKPSLLRLMKKVNLFVANDAEARSLTGENNLIKAAKRLRRLGPALIVIKKGEHGVLFYCDRFMFSFPAYPVEEVIDPTGAGDTFAGALMGYLSRVKELNEKELKQAVLHATTVASFNVEGFGMSKTSTLTLARVRGRMKQLLKFMKP